MSRFGLGFYIDAFIDLKSSVEETLNAERILVSVGDLVTKLSSKWVKNGFVLGNYDGIFYVEWKRSL